MGTEFYDIDDAATKEEDNVDGQGSLGDLISQLAPIDGVNVPATGTPMFGGGTATPVTRGPMTLEELTVQADTSSQVTNVMFYALKRIEKWFEDFKVKEARKEKKVRDLTNQITENEKG